MRPTPLGEAIPLQNGIPYLYRNTKQNWCDLLALPTADVRYFQTKHVYRDTINTSPHWESCLYHPHPMSAYSSDYTISTRGQHTVSDLVYCEDCKTWHTHCPLSGVSWTPISVSSDAKISLVARRNQAAQQSSLTFSMTRGNTTGNSFFDFCICYSARSIATIHATGQAANIIANRLTDRGGRLMLQ